MNTNLILPHHAAMLEESAISPKVIEARDYRSIERKSHLRSLGFSESQAIAPTLLLPIWSAGGSIALYHHRPDRPRMRDGKVSKYEFPTGARMVVDVHPHIQEKIRDPRVPLFITEGVKKADAAISLGLCCIALPGVWNWRGTNEYDGKTALPDWHSIALKGRNDFPREVYIAYDSDVTTKPQVHEALAQFARFLESRGAKVNYIYLPAGEGATKIGLDDYIAQGHGVNDLMALATPDLRHPPQDQSSNTLSIPYRETANGLVWVSTTRDGNIERPLTNFTAHIVGAVVEDDGAETDLTLDMEARLNGRPYGFRVSAASFSSMNWPLEQMGPGAVVYAGMGLRDHTRTAIQLLSENPAETRCYKHTGWREIEPGQWIYLHANGAIQSIESANSAAPCPVVELPDPLRGMALPDAPQDDQALADAVRASFRLWELAPDEITIPIVSAVFRAAVDKADFSIWLAGPSGAFKTALAALAQQHFGAGLDARNLPASWSSTDNALEGLAFVAKDSLLVIDDYAPVGSALDVNRLNAKVDRVLRGQGNSLARQRMKSDGSLRPTKPPRGIILSTGEDLPPGVSLRGRMLTIELAHGDIKPTALTACQQDAANGVYASAMAAFLTWLAPRYSEECKRLRKRVVELRTAGLAESDGTTLTHARTPEIGANLLAGLELFLRFALERGVLSRQEYKERFARALAAVLLAEHNQSAHHISMEPTRRFLSLLSTALASGKAHLANTEGDKPQIPVRFGWREVKTGSGLYESTAWRPQGDCVGWVNETSGDLWLMPDAALGVVKRLSGETGEMFTLTRYAINKRLHERGLLLATDSTRQTLTVRRRLAGATRDVLHLPLPSLLSETPDIPDTSDT